MLNICYVVWGALAIIIAVVSYLLVKKSNIDVIKVMVPAALLAALLFGVAYGTVHLIGCNYQVRTVTLIAFGASILAIAGVVYVLYNEKTLATKKRMATVAIVAIAIVMAWCAWYGTKTSVCEYRAAFVDGTTIIGIDEDGKTKPFNSATTPHSNGIKEIEEGDSFWEIKGGGFPLGGPNGSTFFITTEEPVTTDVGRE